MYFYASFEGIRNSERNDKILCKINLVVNKYSILTILFFQEYCLMFDFFFVSPCAGDERWTDTPCCVRLVL